MRVRLFVREPEAIFWIMVFPVLLALGLGIAFRNRPSDQFQVAATTAHLTQALNNERPLSAAMVDETSGRRALAVGKILLLVIQEPNGVTYLYDDTNPDARTARLLADNAIQTDGGRRDPVRSSDLLAQEAGSRYIDFVVPGILGMNVLGSAIWWLTSSIVEARQKQLLKLLVGSPMPRWQYLAAFPLSSLLLFVVEIGVFLGLARLIFGVPFRGSIWQLGLLCLIAAVSFTGIGLLISSRARTIEAANGWINLTALPMWILSGVFFSANRFPSVIQPFVRMLPLTAAIDSFRANMLQGIGIEHLLGPVTVMAAWFIVPFCVSIRIFRWR
jgi:ABC-2 type transport system permease protein